MSMPKSLPGWCNVKRTLQVIVAVATALTIAGCAFNPSTRDEAAGSSAEAGMQSPTRRSSRRT